MTSLSKEERDVKYYWEPRIFERDKYRCRTCASKCGLQLAHVTDRTEFPNTIDSYRWDNLVCLCWECHNAYHRSRRGFSSKRTFWRVPRVYRLFAKIKNERGQ